MVRILNRFIKPLLRRIKILGFIHRSYFSFINLYYWIYNHYKKAFFRTAPILLYHRVATLSADPVKLSVTPETFENHVKFLKQHYNLLPLSELSNRIVHNTLIGNEAAITFDDGYRDNLTNALPILEKYNVPATIFVTTGSLGNKASFEWDMLYTDIDRAVFLNEDEIRNLSSHPLIEIGVHTESHPRLSKHTYEYQKEEVEKSKLALERIIQKSVRSFAYPFGNIHDFNKISEKIVEELGFDFAYSNTQSLSNSGNRRFCIPRINMRECTETMLRNKILTPKEKVKGLSGKMYRYSYSFLVSPFTKGISKELFRKTYDEMKGLYATYNDKYQFSEFVVPQWNENMLEIEKYFLNAFSFSFLNYPVIKRTMFMYTFKPWRNIQKKLISEYLPNNEAVQILKEFKIGKPLLNDLEYRTSGNNIHHLYHLIKFFKETCTKASGIHTVIEVGGGYGNMAKIYKYLNKESTYVIIDIPIFSYIQAVYLKTVFGKDAVHMVHGDDLNIKKGAINLIPLDKRTFATTNKALTDLNADLFVSTWALSESNAAMQDYIKGQDYFKSKYLLLAYQKSVESFAFAENIQDISASYEKIFDAGTEYVKENYYLFCKRNRTN